MDQQKYCDLENMIRFLLALCCQGDSSTTPPSREKSLDGLFEDCFTKVGPVATSLELRKELDV